MLNKIVIPVKCGGVELYDIGRIEQVSIDRRFGQESEAEFYLEIREVVRGAKYSQSNSRAIQVYLASVSRRVSESRPQGYVDHLLKIEEMLDEKLFGFLTIKHSEESLSKALMEIFETFLDSNEFKASPVGFDVLHQLSQKLGTKSGLEQRL